MIRITGDAHGAESKFYYTEGPCRGQLLPRYRDMGPGDVLIIAGDAGYVWDTSKKRREILRRIAALPFTVAFVDGNHENFDLLEGYEEETWAGGRVHRIRHNLVHLMRGECYELEGSSFFCFGGAASVDRGYESENLRPWWPRELPDMREYDHGRDTLARWGGKIDYIVTHTCPDFLIPSLGGKVTAESRDAYLTGYLRDVARIYAPEFKCFYFGHWHLDLELHGGRYRALYQDVVDIETREGSGERGKRTV